MTDSMDSEKRSSAHMSNVFRATSVSGAAGGRSILALVAGFFAVLAFTASSKAMESGSIAASAQEAPTVQITVQNHQFQPSEISIPANGPIVLKVRNVDATAMEFESNSLRLEKVIPANSEGIIHIRALKPGRYDFFDDFHEETRGTVVVQ